MGFALEYQVKRLKEENETLRATLEFYSDIGTYQHHPPDKFSPIWNDKGKKARKALRLGDGKNVTSKQYDM